MKLVPGTSVHANLRTCVRFSIPIKPKFPNPPKMVTPATTPLRKPTRPVCPTCAKPARTCLCSRILAPSLHNSVAVTVLQHSLEKKHPLNSTRILKLGLRNVTVAAVSDVNFDAKFSISLLRQASEAGADGVNGAHFCLGNIGESEVEVKDANGDFRPRNDQDCLLAPPKDVGVAKDSRVSLNSISLGGRSGEAIISVSMGKKGVIKSLDHMWISHGDCLRAGFDDLLACASARDVLSNGFVVRKLQNGRVVPSAKLEEYEDFTLEVPRGSVLLFPTENALGIDELKKAKIEARNLIVLDGTWMKARRMYSENPWLKLLPHLKLDLEVVSLYEEVRSQPRAGCLSTLESVVYTLKAVGDDVEGLDQLLEVFESMVNDQRRCKDERLRAATEE